MAEQKAQRSVVISGDVTLDWHIVNRSHDSSPTPGWNPTLWTRACSQIGGAGMLANLVETITRTDPELGAFTIIKPSIPTSEMHPCLPACHHSYALWSEYKGIWRVEQFLGLDNHTKTDDEATLRATLDADGSQEIVILDDAKLGFRDNPALWPKAIREGASPDWILLKMACPVATGPLWEHLRDNFAEKLIVILPVQDLRRSEVHISRGLSWERTAQDLAWELVHNPAINSLSACAHVIISFDTGGAFHLTHQRKGTAEDPPQSSLFFDPETIEGTWKQNFDGAMIGYTSALTASIAYQLLKAPNAPDIEQGIQSGLAAVRELHQGGYAFDDEGDQNLSFPYQRIAEEIIHSQSSFAAVPVQNPVFSYKETENNGQNRQGWWTILEDQYRENLAKIAEEIVLNGVEDTLQNVPQGRFGHLLTVDRHEIESFRSINNLAAEYLGHANQKRPLSIAVFGAPGSGKSFGITQVAQTLAGDRLQVLEFNLSQFAGPEEIIDSLHQVRDVVLKGGIPLVFWDEFDTPLNDKPLGWLRYFLSPMQDGSFRQGQLIHPIGRSIFVFAGGTSHRIDEFGKNLIDDDGNDKAYRDAKVPDFISRLKGFVNILGPNPPEHASEAERKANPYYIIRRAILLRSLLERNAKQIFASGTMDIDHGILQAFLGIDRYKHGIRSIESIIVMSSLSGKQSFERSSLPAQDQLNLHVDAEVFLSLVHKLKLEGDLLEKLAQANHRVYQRRMTNEAAQDPDNSAHLSWDALPDDEKDQNRDSVRHIPDKLSEIGFIMIPSRSNQPIFKFPDNDADLEKLAQLEHRRWVRAKEDAGWVYGPETDKAKKIHASMKPWDDLTDKDKDTDIEFVKAIPEILAEAGYTMVKIQA
ncbi:ATPase [bacterium]|nr:ATPase [bacterium]